MATGQGRHVKHLRVEQLSEWLSQSIQCPIVGERAVRRARGCIIALVRLTQCAFWTIFIASRVPSVRQPHEGANTWIGQARSHFSGAC
jgi:hypothetical protein